MSGTCTNWHYNSRSPDSTILGAGGWREGKSRKLSYVHLTNGSSDLNETWYIERCHVSGATFSIRIGHWGVEGETKFSENAYSGEIGMKLDGKNKRKFEKRDWHNRTRSDIFGGVGGIFSALTSLRISKSSRWLLLFEGGGYKLTFCYMEIKKFRSYQPVY